MYRVVLLWAALLGGPLFAQQPFTFTTKTQPAGAEAGGGMARMVLDLPALRRQLAEKRLTLDLPLPDGTYATFTAAESSVFAPALAARYPLIGSYRVEGPWGAGRVAISQKGVDALLYGPAGSYVIEAIGTGDGYRAYYTAGEHDPAYDLPLACGYDPADPRNVPGDLPAKPAAVKGRAKRGNDAQELRVYDMAVTNTGEFATAVGGTKEDVLAAFNTAISTVNVIFEREVAVRINLLPVSEELIYLDPETDPFKEANSGIGLLPQVIEAFLENDIPAGSYDLGHVFTGRCGDVGGVVGGLACSGSKTRGVTCLQGGNVANTARRIMAHELAHQFSVSHSWNQCPSSANQRAEFTAYEPGSGSTIMSYAGACGDQNIGGFDAYFHTASLQQFLHFTGRAGAAGCATVIETDNRTPEVQLDYTDDFFIPQNTPFRLTGTATDANDPADQLTYTWEEFDLGPATNLYEAEGNAPIFRSVAPSAEGNTRYFPRVDRVANGIQTKDEVLPTYERDLTFRLTARDNNEAAGGVEWAAVSFHVAESGPLTVNEPEVNAEGAWQEGEYREVTWNVNGTDEGPVNARTVDILLSRDGGLTFDEVLAAGVANNGSTFVTVPDGAGDAMRIIVAASDNIFYNMHAADFSITPATEPTYTLDADLRYADVCQPATVTTTFTVGDVGDFTDPVTLTVDPADLPAGLSADLSHTQVLPGQTSVLTLDISRVTRSGRIVVPVTVTSAGLQDSRREIVLDVVSDDFSDLALTGPEEGTEGIGLSTEFSWSPARNAESYDVEVATSPAFTDAVRFASASRQADTLFSPEAYFTANTVYYWRVRPRNECGAGPWTETASFRTVGNRCVAFTPADTPVPLPGTGAGVTRQSTITVPDHGVLSDLNIPGLKINYQYTSDVTVSLTSPAGTTVTLFREQCFSATGIDVGFDDQAPELLACPPLDGRLYRPLDSLSAFDGEDAFGVWTLAVTIKETNGAAGQLVGWSLEACTDAAAPAPVIIVNEPTLVRPLGRNPVVRSDLEIATGTDAPAATTYRITRLPADGRLERAGQVLVLGDAFTQADINDGLLIYENLDSTGARDSFGFVVTTAAGGYLPVTSHEITLTADAINPVRSPDALDASLTIYPNPTTDRVQLRWSPATARSVAIELYDPTGRRVLRQSARLSDGEASLDLTALPGGLYVLRLGSTTRRVVKY
ncbi:reprolysin-like metallopeptidase [Lewinella sp. IMCC34183]|uniref:reprolysin-like metallopeptidase n=1 Tax=Lewinella sp. IMCC34183 TaxID=2248762 RepID=UPI000E22381F|nr:zinc-dependent metalloprotease family protein [Lewinella sp. IMCC34183]